jgi:copper(I)-binding protein
MLKQLVVGVFTFLLIGNAPAHAVKAGDLVIEHAHARATKGSAGSGATEPVVVVAAAA